MSYIPPNPNGQATQAASTPVVIAVDQQPVPVYAVSDGTNTFEDDANAESVILVGPLGDPVEMDGNALRTSAKITDDLETPVSVIQPNTIGQNAPVAPRNNALVTAPATTQAMPWEVFAVTNFPATGGLYVGNYKSISVQIKSLYTGTTPTITFQGTNDNPNSPTATWVSVLLESVASGAIPASATTGTGIFYGSVNYLYFRLAFTGAYSSGSSTGTIVFSTSPSTFTTIQNATTGTQVAQGNKTNNAAVPAATNMGVLPAVANAVAPGYTETFQTLASTDLLGQTRVKSDLPLKINVEQIDGNEMLTTSPGVQGVGLVNELGDPIGSTNDSLHVIHTAPMPVLINPPVNSNVTSVTSVATNSVPLLASNPGRRMAMFFNSSTAVLYLKFGLTASLTSYTVQLAAGQYYELPSPAYTGEIDGIWASQNGAVLVTEIT